MNPISRGTLPQTGHVGLTPFLVFLPWTDKILHHLDTGNHYLLVFAGECSFQGLLGGAKWIFSIHSMNVPGSNLCFHLVKFSFFNFPLLVFKGNYHYWTDCFFPGDVFAKGGVGTHISPASARRSISEPRRDLAHARASVRAAGRRNARHRGT